MPLMLAVAVLVGLGPAPQAPGFPIPPRSLAVAAGQGEAVLKAGVRPVRWAVMVGTVDFRAIRAAVPGLPRPDAGPFWPCKRVDLQRQARLTDGGWSDWAPVDVEANLQVLDNLAEVASERVRPEARPEAFVDPLPSLKSGDLRGVDVDALVDGRLRDVPRRAVRPGVRFPARAADEVMIRAFDFTARPGTTYRYRVRAVVLDPAPRHAEMFGPWSEPTGEVTMAKE